MKCSHDIQLKKCEMERADALKKLRELANELRECMKELKSLKRHADKMERVAREQRLVVAPPSATQQILELLQMRQNSITARDFENTWRFQRYLAETAFWRRMSEENIMLHGVISALQYRVPPSFVFLRQPPVISPLEQPPVILPLVQPPVILPIEQPTEYLPIEQPTEYLPIEQPTEYLPIEPTEYLPIEPTEYLPIEPSERHQSSKIIPLGYRSSSKTMELDDDLRLQNQELRERNRQLTIQIERLKDSQVGDLKTIRSLRIQLERCLQENEKLKSKIRDLDETSMDLETEKGSSRHTRKVKSAFKKEKTILEKQDIKAKLEKCLDEKRELKLENEKLKQKINIGLKTNEILQTAHEFQISKLHECQKEIEKLRTELEIANAEQFMPTKEGGTDLENEREQYYQTKLHNLSLKIHELNKDNDSLQEENVLLRSDILVESKKTIESLRAELDELKSIQAPEEEMNDARPMTEVQPRVSSKQVNKWISENKDLQEKLKKCTVQWKDCLEELNRSKAEDSKKREVLEKYKTDLNQLSAEIESQHTIINSLKDKNQTLQIELDELKSIQAQDEEMEELARPVTEVQTRSSRIQINKLNSEKKELQEKLKKCKDKLDDRSKADESKKREVLEKYKPDLNQLSAKIESQCTIINSLKGSNQTLQIELDELKSIQAQDENMEELARPVTEVSRQTRVSSKQINKLNSELQEKLTKCKDKLRACLENLDRSKAEESKKREVLEKYRKDLNEISDEIESQRTVIISLKDRNETLISKISEQEEIIVEFQNKTHDAVKTNQALLDKNSNLETQIEILKEQLQLNENPQNADFKKCFEKLTECNEKLLKLRTAYAELRREMDDCEKEKETCTLENDLFRKTFDISNDSDLEPQLRKKHEWYEYFKKVFGNMEVAVSSVYDLIINIYNVTDFTPILKSHRMWIRVYGTVKELDKITSKINEFMNYFSHYKSPLKLVSDALALARFMVGNSRDIASVIPELNELRHITSQTQLQETLKILKNVYLNNSKWDLNVLKVKYDISMDTKLLDLIRKYKGHKIRRVENIPEHKTPKKRPMDSLFEETE